MGVRATSGCRVQYPLWKQWDGIMFLHCGFMWTNLRTGVKRLWIMSRGIYLGAKKTIVKVAHPLTIPISGGRFAGDSHCNSNGQSECIRESLRLSAIASFTKANHEDQLNLINFSPLFYSRTANVVVHIIITANCLFISIYLSICLSA